MKKDRNYLLDRLGGVVYGTAIGDALGYQVEFKSMDQIDAMGGVHDLVSNLYSDDTQMFRAVLEGLIRARPDKQKSFDTLDHAAEEVAAEFIAWSKSPENNRAPGASCMLGCRNLDEGVDWFKAGKLKGGGCGAAMRSMAYGMYYFDDPFQAAFMAAQHALMTHRSPMAQASAAAVAVGVSHAISGLDPYNIVDAMVSIADLFDKVSADMIREAHFLAEMNRNYPYPENEPRTVLDRWRGWAGHEAVAASVYCFTRYQRSYKDAVLLAVNSPGDSDSLGAITGALSGAYLGQSNIPEDWVKRIEKSDQLSVYPERLIRAAVHLGLEGL